MKKMKLPPNLGAGMTGIRNISLFALLIISLIVTIIIFRQVLINETHRAEYISLTDELRLVSQQMPGLAIEAASGNAEAFGGLEEKVDEFALALKKVTSKATRATIQGAWEGLVNPRAEIASVSKIWVRNNHPFLRPKKGRVKRSRNGAQRNFSV